MKRIKDYMKVFSAGLISVALCCVYFVSCAQENIISVNSYGAKGDGKTNDTKAINAAILAAAKENKKLVFGKNQNYLVDTISLVGNKSKTFQKLVLLGNKSKISCINRGRNNVLNFFFIDTLIIQDLGVVGNKDKKNNGNGIGIYYSNFTSIENCIIQDCKYSGILVAWVKYAQLNNNVVFNNGDGSLPTDGISIHSLMEGVISRNIIFNNNPKDTQDGDGIQIGSIKYGVKNYYNPSSIEPIKVFENICYQHGRRGIKIQRSQVLAYKNFLSENAIGISVVNGLDSVNKVLIQSNVIQKSYKGITTDAGGKPLISNLTINNNYFLGSIMTERIYLQDVSHVKILHNFFDKHNIDVFDKNKHKVNFLNMAVAPTLNNIDSSENKNIDIRNVVPINKTQVSDLSDSFNVIKIVKESSTYSIPENKGNDFFCVFTNSRMAVANLKINFKGKMNIYRLKKDQLAIIYTSNNKLIHFFHELF